jgi:hypothetical protein
MCDILRERARTAERDMTIMDTETLPKLRSDLLSAVSRAALCNTLRADVANRSVWGGFVFSRPFLFVFFSHSHLVFLWHHPRQAPLFCFCFGSETCNKEILGHLNPSLIPDFENFKQKMHRDAELKELRARVEELLSDAKDVEAAERRAADAEARCERDREAAATAAVRAETAEEEVRAADVWLFFFFFFFFFFSLPFPIFFSHKYCFHLPLPGQ